MRNRIFNAKVSNRARLREADTAVAENAKLRAQGARSWAILASILGELGGEVIVSDKTLELIGTDFHLFDFAVEEGPEEGTSLVRLLKDGAPFVRDDEPAEPAIDAEFRTDVQD